MTTITPVPQSVLQYQFLSVQMRVVKIFPVNLQLIISCMNCDMELLKNLNIKISINRLLGRADCSEIK
jgi:hypothetical protein